jgi:hypothetical protein
MLVAILALFVALGGSSYAAVSLQKNSVGTAQLKANAVTGSKIKKNSVPGNRIKPNSLGGRQINEAGLGTVPLAAQAEDASNADQLGGLSPSDFVKGNGNAFVNRASAEVSGVFDPQTVTQPLESIPGVGSFTLLGSFNRPGSDCLITFTNESGGPVAVNGDATPGLADGGTTQLVGVGSRPEGDDTSFTLLTESAAEVVSGQATVTFGFPSANTACAGAVTGLTGS